MIGAILVHLASQHLDEAWADPALKCAVIGAGVWDSNGNELYAHNADLLMLPASNQKIVTAAIALKNLGPDYKPETRFWKFKDKIVVLSNGDPIMTHDDLLTIRQQLKIGKPRAVEVHSAYGPLLPPGWEWDDLRNKYAAPVSAFSVDRSSFELWHEGDKLFYQPESYGAKAFFHRSDGPLKIDFDPATMTANVYGVLSAARERLDTLAIGRPDVAAASILGHAAPISDEVPNQDADLVWQGKLLSEILKDELPSSDNNVSENLLLMAEHVIRMDGDPYAAATSRAGNDLAAMGLQQSEFSVADGSGLSRHNVITAHALAKILVYEDQQSTRDLWHSCLAKPGEPGTLQHRLEGIAFEGKTGTMDKVSALCGYLHLNSGKELIVVILVNNYLCNTAQTRDLIDQFIKNVQAAGNEGTLFAESYNYASTRPNAISGCLAYHWVP